ncbi:MAG: hypothetical protein K0U59_12105 [Gammaproteobacteria bacterium]|nr:hypothetical protein [Gammaproteobacteria bacterium]
MNFKKTMLATIATLTLSTTVDAETIDISILYTQPAAEKTGDITAKIDSLVSYANQVYADNSIDIQLRLVGSAKVSDADLRVTENSLNLVTSSSSVQNYRKNNGSDMVVLLGKADTIRQNDQTFLTCGIAWVGIGSDGTMDRSSRDRAYSVTAVDCGANTFIHELGHNMGLVHSRKQGDRRGGVYSYGMGHGVENSFATIMAYPHVFGRNVTHFDIFSDPNSLACNNQRCGEAGISEAHQALLPIIDDVAAYY